MHVRKEAQNVLRRDLRIVSLSEKNKKYCVITLDRQQNELFANLPHYARKYNLSVQITEGENPIFW